MSQLSCPNCPVQAALLSWPVPVVLLQLLSPALMSLSPWKSCSLQAYLSCVDLSRLTCWGWHFRMTCPVWPFQADLSRLSCPGCSVLAVLSRLSYPGCPIPAVLSRLSYPGCPIPTVLSRLSIPAVFSLLSCPRCPVKAVLSRLSCLSVVLSLLSWSG
jgi:hypothetical protein